MVTKFRRFAKVLPAIKAKLSDEPIMWSVVVLIVFQAYGQAAAQHLSGQDLLLYIGEFLMARLPRALVYPAAKVDSATAALKSVEPELEKPYVGDV